MEKKNITEVVIDGTIYRLGGYESSEYLQQVAGYINSKITEMKALDGYNHLPTSLKALMMELNAADDFFKARKSADRLEKELSDKDRELYGVKHDLVTLQVKMEEADRTILSLKEENSDCQKRILELETRLSGLTDKPAGQAMAEQLMAEQAAGTITAGEAKTAEAIREEAEEDQIPGQLSFTLKADEEDRKTSPEPEGTGEKDTGDVFRPETYTAREESSDKEKAAPEESAEKSARTFVPDAAGREAMMRSARENFLNSSSYGRKRNRKH